MKTCEKIVIVGAGGHARELLDLVEAINAEGERYEVLGYLVDPEYAAAGTVIHDRPVLGGLDWLDRYAAEASVVCGIGYPHVRHGMVQRAAARGARFVSLVHPRALLTRRVELGSGVVIAAGCILTNQIRLGDHVQLNLSTTISHDCVLGAFASTGPGVHVAGSVVLEEGAYLSTGVSVIPGVRVGRWAVVGAGAAVVRDVPANAVAVGVPAEVKRVRPEGWHRGATT